MRTRAYHHGDLRAALLERAELTLREKGAGALSLRELARDLDVSHAAPSRHFKDKRALLDALAAIGFERLAAGIHRAVAAAGDGFQERMTAFARSYVDFAVGNPGLLELMFERKHDSASEHELRAAWYALEDEIHRVIEAGQREGRVRSGEVGRIAGVASAAVVGVVALAGTARLSGPELDQVFEDVLATLLRGLAPAPAPLP